MVVMLGACGGDKPAGAPAGVTVPSTGPLESALLTQSQLRRVPGLATALVNPLPDAAPFDEPDPRGPCGAPLPVLALDDAMATGWRATSIRAGGQVVLRRPASELQRYMAARIRDTKDDCPAFQTKNRQGVTQETKFDAAVRVTRNADQSLAVVMALRLDGSLRAATTIEVRSGNLLSRAVIVTNRPMPTPTVRGIASLMANALASVA
jgi:hypothetical protein